MHFCCITCTRVYLALNDTDQPKCVRWWVSLRHLPKPRLPTSKPLIMETNKKKKEPKMIIYGYVVCTNGGGGGGGGGERDSVYTDVYEFHPPIVDIYRLFKNQCVNGL